MGKNFLIMAMILCLIGCTKDTDEPADQNTLILGRWKVTAYYSGQYYTPINNGDYYEFTDGQCVYYAGNVIDTYDYYQYSFIGENHISCTHDNGWNLDIHVEFINGDEAIFNITGRTSTQSKTVKVKRAKQ